MLPTYPRAFAASADVLAALCRAPREPVLAPAIEAPRRDYCTRLLLNVGAGAALRVVHTPGHTPDSLCLHYPPDRALFTADTVLGHGTAVFEELAPYMASLRKLADFAEPQAEVGGAQTYATVYPGHGPVVADGHAKVSMYLRHRVEREEQIVKVLRQSAPNGGELAATTGTDEGWTVDAIVATIYAKYPKELWAPAAHSVELHLNKLGGEGRVEKVGTAWVLLSN